MKSITILRISSALISIGAMACSGTSTEFVDEPQSDAAVVDDADAGDDTDFGVEPAPGAERVTHAFGAVTLQPGEEITNCVQWTLGNDKPLYVNTVKLTNRGGFHHSNWFVVPDDYAAGDDGYYRCGDRGFNEIGAATSGTVLFAQSTQSQVEAQDLPDGVVVKIPPNHKIVGSIHLLNISTQVKETPLNMAIDIIHPRDVEVVATPFRLTYYPLEIEPTGESRFRGTCTFRDDYERVTGGPIDLKLYYVLPHYHELGNRFSLQLQGGPRDGEELFKLEGFNAEANGQAFDPPIDFAENGADGLTFECGYNNPRDETVGWGIGDQEMCVMLGLADSKLLMDMSVARGATTEVVETTSGGVPVRSGSCSVLPLSKNPNQTMPTAEETEGEFYVPESDGTVDGEIEPQCEDFPGAVEPFAEPTIENVQRDLFAPGCTFSACHDVENPAFGLDLASPGVRARLLDHGLMTDVEMPLVTPGNPDESWLWKVTSECQPMATDGAMEPMPRNSPTLAPANTLEMLRLWIANGAN